MSHVDSHLIARWTTGRGAEAREALIARPAAAATWRARFDEVAMPEGRARLDLRGIDLAGVDLTGADLSGADLGGADLRHARLDGADLQLASLDDARLDGATGHRVVLASAVGRAPSFAGATFDELDLTNADLEAASFRRSTLRRASVSNAWLPGLDAREATILDSELDGVDLQGARFDASALARVRFDRCDLSAATFAGARLEDVAFQWCRVDDRDLAATVTPPPPGEPVGGPRRSGTSPSLVGHPFAPLFEHGRYLALLQGRVDDVGDALVRSVAQAIDPDAAIVAGLDDGNWRVELVAAAAALRCPSRPETIAALWRAIDRGTWVSPQVAVALSLLDPAFPAGARARIEHGTASFKTRGALRRLLGLAEASDPGDREGDEALGARIAEGWQRAAEALRSR